MRVTASGIAIPWGWWAPSPRARLELRRHAQDLGLILAAAATLALACVLKYYNVRWFWYNPWLHAYSLLVTVFILSRAAIALCYREPKDRGFLPTVSLIIAVKNEEAHIAETIHCCYASRYPAGRFEVLVIDDGSTDRTWEIVQALGQRYAALRAFQLPDGEHGKRHAMALGTQRGTGEIVVVVDSDSLLERDALYKIVQPFADERVGAVAGHVEVVVDPANPISKMEAVRYFISHRFMKAAESVFGAVTCCSGAFSAYRREAVLRILPQWLHQTFCGVRSTFGDDRSLTNFILRSSRVVFHHGARCRTYVPDAWQKYFRQQLRWKKSWTRETLVATRIIYRKHPVAALSYYTGILLTLVAPMMVLRNVVYLPIVHAQTCVPYLAGLTLIYLFFCTFYYYFTRSRYWLYGFSFALLYVGVLSWQNYYAIATVRRSHWGTR